MSDDPNAVFMEDVDIAEVFDDEGMDAPEASSDEEEEDPMEAEATSHAAGSGPSGGEGSPDPTQTDPNLVKDKSIQGFFEHTEPVYCIATHPTDPSIAATGGGDDKAYLWDSLTGEKLADLSGHSDSIVSVAFNFDGEYVATGGMDGVVKIWRTATGEEVETLSGPGEAIEWVQWHPKGNVILAGSADTTMWMWKVPGATCMNVFAGHADAVLSGTFVNKGKSIATTSADGSLRIWDPKTAECVHLVAGELFHEGAVLSLDEHRSNPVVLTGSEDSVACITNYTTGKVVGRLTGHSDAIEAVSFSRFAGDVTLAATGSLDQKAIIWDVNTLQERQTLAHEGGVVKVAWHPTSSMLFTASLDGVVRTWDGRTGQQTNELTGHGAHVLAMTLDCTGRRLLSASEDNTALVFGLENEVPV